jgi:ABC-type polar amino acid transport system ATPase subunit
MIKIESVRKSFKNVEVLKSITIDVNKGDVVALIGSSGSGKSTLLQCINGLESIDSGRILVDGIDVHAKGTDIAKLRQRIGIVFQSFNVFPHYTVLENVALAPRIVLRVSREEALERARFHIDKVGLSVKLDVYPNNLSGGQQQRLSIARALAMNPEYILLDEITSALDPELVGEVLDTLRILRQEGMTMVLVTHEIPFAREIADRVFFLDGGVICESGTASEVLDNAKNARTQQFLSKVLWARGVA